MSLFKKQKPAPEPAGRRRPVSADSSAQRTQAFSYYAQRSAPQANTGRGSSIENTAVAAERPWYLQRGVVSVGSVVVLLLVLYSLTLSSTPKIVPVTASGSAYFMQDPSAYRQTAAQSLGSSVFNFNKLTVDTAKVSRNLTAHYPEIHTATVVIPLFGHQPIVYITPYRPSFVLTTTDSKAYLLDENGRALASTSQIADQHELSVPTLQDKSGIQIQLGAQALPQSTVAFIEQVVSILDAAHVRYQSLVLPPASSELDVYVTGTPYFVKFNLQGDAKLETGTFLATKQRLETDKITPAQYIDVRVNERAYYK